MRRPAKHDSSLASHVLIFLMLIKFPTFLQLEVPTLIGIIRHNGMLRHIIEGLDVLTSNLSIVGL